MSDIKEKSHIKELFSHTLVYGIGLLVNKSLGVILLPLYTAYFTTEEIGVYALVYSLWMFISIIYMYGMETSFLKFFIDRKDHKERSVIYSTSIVMILCSSVFFSAVLYFSAGAIASLIGFENSAQASDLIRIVAFMLFFDALYRFPLLLLRSELKFRVYFYLTTFMIFINLGLNILFIVYFKMNIEAIFYSYLISVLVTFLVGIVITRKYLIWSFSKKIARELIVYGNKFIYIGLFLILIDISDRFFLKFFYDESLVGIYNTNYRLASVMSMIILAFRFSWTPYFLNIAEHPENKQIISRVFTYFVFTGMLLFLIFAFFTEPLIKTRFFGIYIMAPDFWAGLKIIPVLLLTYFFSGLFATLHVAPFFKNKTGYIFWIALGGLALYFVLNLILIPRFQMMGAAYATLITYFIMFILIYFVSQRIFRIEYSWRSISLIGVFTAICYLINLLITKFFPSTLTLYLSAAGCILLFLLLVYVTKAVDFSKARVLFGR